MDIALPTLDADVAFPSRKPQFASEFDPRWNVSFYHGLGAGSYSLAPYVNRGYIPPLELGSGATIAPSRDGWAFSAPTAGANGNYSVAGASITWAPSQTRGSFVMVFRALASSSADTVARNLFEYGDWSTRTNGCFQITRYTNGYLYTGWYTSGTGTSITTADTGLWGAGELVVLVVTYDTFANSQNLYLNGSPVNSNSVATGNATGIGTNNINIGNTGGAGESCDWPILYTAFLDRVLTTREIAWIAANPLNWMFSPGPIAASVGTGLVNFLLSCAAGVFNLTGAAVALLAGRKLTAAAGAFALTGKPASITAARKLAAAPAAFTLTGGTASITAARKLAAAPGAFALTGGTVAITAARKLTASPAAFVLTGEAVTFAVGLVFSVLPAAYVITGEPAALLASRLLAASKGIFSLTGEPISIHAARKLTASAGVFQLTGAQGGLLAHRVITLAPAAFVLTGEPAAFSIASTMYAWKPSGRLSPYLQIIATAAQAQATPAAAEMQADVSAAQPVPTGVSE